MPAREDVSVSVPSRGDIGVPVREDVQVLVQGADLESAEVESLRKAIVGTMLRRCSVLRFGLIHRSVAHMAGRR